MALIVRYRRDGGSVVFGAAETLEAVEVAPLGSTLFAALAADPGGTTERPGALLAPVDRQEVWAAGVTYLQSRDARVDESEEAGDLYTRVYGAERPELFFKALPMRVRGPRESICVRSDSVWNVPEPELAVLCDPSGQIAAASIGNDVSSRSIEGENPLYLPQAKVYEGSCALGPGWVPIADAPPLDALEVELVIERDGAERFRGSTSTSKLRRSLEELVSWLGRALSFPDGVVLLTGTSIVPRRTCRWCLAIRFGSPSTDWGLSKMGSSWRMAGAAKGSLS
jgi:2-dehydro-3-deoxy-D-arabinonate dehydratase